MIEDNTNNDNQNSSTFESKIKEVNDFISSNKEEIDEIQNKIRTTRTTLDSLSQNYLKQLSFLQKGNQLSPQNTLSPNSKPRPVSKYKKKAASDQTIDERFDKFKADIEEKLQNALKNLKIDQPKLSREENANENQQNNVNENQHVAVKESEMINNSIKTEYDDRLSKFESKILKLTIDIEKYKSMVSQLIDSQTFQTNNTTRNSSFYEFKDILQGKRTVMTRDKKVTQVIKVEAEDQNFTQQFDQTPSIQINQLVQSNLRVSQPPPDINFEKVDNLKDSEIQAISKIEVKEITFPSIKITSSSNQENYPSASILSSAEFAKQSKQKEYNLKNINLANTKDLFGDALNKQQHRTMRNQLAQTIKANANLRNLKMISETPKYVNKRHNQSYSVQISPRQNSVINRPKSTTKPRKSRAVPSYEVPLSTRIIRKSTERKMNTPSSVAYEPIQNIDLHFKVSKKFNV